MTSSAVGIINRMLCNEVIGVQRRMEAEEKQTDPIYSAPGALSAYATSRESKDVSMYMSMEVGFRPTGHPQNIAQLFAVSSR